MSASRLTVESICNGLGTRRVGRDLRVFDELDSTNRYLLDGSNEPDSDGSVVIAERQTGGRGRMGRTWDCPRGAGLLCSVLLHDPRRLIDANLLALIVPVAVRDAVLESTGVVSEIKWPNDLLVNGRKLGGVLIERGGDDRQETRYVIGIGLNCLQHRGHFPDKLRDVATSLELECPHAIDRAAILRAVLRGLDEYVADPSNWSAARICELWKERAQPAGSAVVLRHDDRTYRGVVIDIDPSASLVVQIDRGGRRLFPAASTTVISS